VLKIISHTTGFKNLALSGVEIFMHPFPRIPEREMVRMWMTDGKKLKVGISRNILDSSNKVYIDIYARCELSPFGQGRVEHGVGYYVCKICKSSKDGHQRYLRTMS
jgi:hypothetical protein